MDRAERPERRLEVTTSHTALDRRMTWSLGSINIVDHFLKLI